MGLLDRLKTRLTRTRAALSDSISGLFRGGRPIDSDLLAELEVLAEVRVGVRKLRDY